MSREERKEQIVGILASYLWAVRVGEIAKRTGLKRSPYLIGLLEELVSEGRVNWHWENDPRYGRCRVFFAF